MPLDPAQKARFDALVSAHPVVVFMKGSRTAPQCGFSATVVRILEGLGAQYETVNVLADSAIREGIKAYSDWPTIPQVFVNGEFLGGSDILKEMLSSGELAEKLGVQAKAAAERPNPPRITVTPAARAALEGARSDSSEVVHLEISASFSHDLFLGPEEASDVVCQGEFPIHLDAASAARAEGLHIDFARGPGGTGFKIENPNEPPKVKRLAAKELAAWREKGAAFELFDVRNPGERATAAIEGAHFFDADGQARLADLPKDTRLVFHCHHGVRSRAAAERVLAQGFTDVWNLEGGIDAWSIDVDPKVPRY